MVLGGITGRGYESQNHAGLFNDIDSNGDMSDRYLNPVANGWIYTKYVIAYMDGAWDSAA